ncbi:MAG: cache domain-containing protein [Chloroflexi bacterium]|nr:cache domain-containing protein [Chloroflexota bacterium]
MKKNGNGKSAPGFSFSDRSGWRLPIATKLILSFLLVIVNISVIFSVVGVQIIGNLIVTEAQDRVRYDLNAAREIYFNKLSRINDIVRFSADRVLLMSPLLSGDVSLATEELVKIREREHLDVLTVTDHTGKVLLRTGNLGVSGDQSEDELARAVLRRKEPLGSTMIVSAGELVKESPALAEKAYFRFADTPKARARTATQETSGMMLMAAAPIFDFRENLIGAVYGGVLLNRNYELVDKVKQTVFQDLFYTGKDFGTATIFQDDVRISTNVKNEDGTRAIGTRIAEDVYEQVIVRGEPWLGRAYVVNTWRITAYEPITDINNQRIGILYVGILEQKYLDIQRDTIFAFFAITLVGVLASMGLAYLISRTISESVSKLAFASRQIARGNLSASVEIASNDELQELAETFNFMTAALKERDRKLKEFATQKIMESERLALVGQLAANVAHELNNPLQGIVAYSHLLLEKMPAGDATTSFVGKIVTQANRCTQIIRGLLDFSRQRKPQKQPSNINVILQECVSLVENQVLFHNIQTTKELCPDLPLVTIDPSQIQQVFMNMLINAAEAMDGSGHLTLATQRDPSAKYVEVQFSDSGHGISESDMAKIFDPFFATKDVGHGTGLGLAISYGIVKEHKGVIAVESQVGQGTTFVVRLPVNGKGESRDGGT